MAASPPSGRPGTRRSLIATTVLASLVAGGIAGRLFVPKRQQPA